MEPREWVSVRTDDVGSYFFCELCLDSFPDHGKFLEHRTGRSHRSKLGAIVPMANITCQTCNSRCFTSVEALVQRVLSSGRHQSERHPLSGTEGRGGPQHGRSFGAKVLPNHVPKTAPKHGPATVFDARPAPTLVGPVDNGGPQYRGLDGPRFAPTYAPKRQLDHGTAAGFEGLLAKVNDQQETFRKVIGSQAIPKATMSCSSISQQTERQNTNAGATANSPTTTCVKCFTIDLGTQLERLGLGFRPPWTLQP